MFFEVAVPGTSLRALAGLLEFMAAPGTVELPSAVQRSLWGDADRSGIDRCDACAMPRCICDAAPQLSSVWLALLFTHVSLSLLFSTQRPRHGAVPAPGEGDVRAAAARVRRLRQGLPGRPGDARGGPGGPRHARVRGGGEESIEFESETLET